ncbi:MAG: iron donor protein CyaY [Bryobacterales bacterium]|nr:iron donor protein CyaY [Bryobacterales bacterium]
MDDQEFSRRADQALEALYGKLAAAAGSYDFDVDMNAGALTIEFDEPPERFVVSPNSPVRQIWVSAHTTSFKLDWDPGRDAFVLPATNETLEQLMVASIARRLDEDFHI